MSKAYQCDRCGTYMSVEEFLKVPFEVKRVPIMDDDSPCKESFDLCKVCSNDLYKWLRNMAIIEEV